MISYILRKIVSTIPTLFGVTFLVFILFNIAGGDPALRIAGKYATAERIAEIRHQHGWDQSLPLQYTHFLKEIVTFDYGTSDVTHQPVRDMILGGIGPSLSLTVPAFFLTTLIAIVIGLLVAYFRGRWVDKVVVIGCVLGMSIPMLAYILFGQYFFAYRLGWFPIHGFEMGFPEQLYSVALPVIIWVMVSLGYDVRFYRTAVLEETNQDYVRTARAKGLAEPRVFLKHVLKNSMAPIITNVVIEIPLLIMGAFLLESFFGIPGIGGITIDALNNSDFQVLKAMTVLQSFLLIFGNTMTDVLYVWVDPRVKLS
ncbi:MAG: ABC transporter permease [Oligoflexia bacterium]|nr:ABC transporter permease [Oligoflexia bacterium]